MKLTKRYIDSLECKSKDYFVWDDDLSGFGVRVFQTGRKQFVVQYRHSKISRRMSLGRYGAIVPDQARKMAMEVLVKVNSGNDPLSDRKELRSALTVRDLADRFDQEHIAVHLKLTTAKEYRRNLKLFILPALGSMRINDVTRADVARFHHDWRHKPYQANRNLEIV